MKLSTREYIDGLRWRNLLPALAILAASWLVYSPAMHGDWLWDDNTEIVRNLDLRGPGALWKIWVAPTSPDYFPIKSTVQWFQWIMWQDGSTWGYHFSNFGLHLLSALLLWHVLWKLGVRYAWAGGLFFALHPVAVESVAWIAELKNVLSLPPLLLAFSAFINFEESRRLRYYWMAVGLFIAALLCKSSVVMFPCFLVIYIWWRRDRVEKRALRGVGLFFLISLAFGVVSLWFQYHRAIDTWTIQLGGPADRLSGAGRALLFYILKCAWPFRLSPIYPAWSGGTSVIVALSAWTGFGTIVTWLWLRRAVWGRHALLALGWFVLNLLPVLGFIKMSFFAIAPVADHFVYLSLAGFAGLLAASTGLVEQRLPAGFRRLPLIIVVVISTVYIWQGRRHASIFVDQQTLWVETLRSNPQSWVAQNNLGVLLLQQGKWPEAAGRFEAAEAYNQRYGPAHVNLGNAYSHLKRLSEAEQQFREALKLEPDSYEAHFNFANTLVQAGRLPEAVEHYEAALGLSPKAADAHYNLANVLLELGRLPEAVAHYEEALHYRPDAFEVHINLGNALAAAGRMSAAVTHFKAAAKLNPQSVDALFALADGLAENGMLTEAEARYKEALFISPDNPVIHASFARLLLRLGRAGEAKEHYEEALRLDPNDREARDGLRNIGEISVAPHMAVP